MPVVRRRRRGRSGSPFSMMFETISISGWPASWNWCSTWICSGPKRRLKATCCARRDALVAKHEHVMVEMRAVDAREIGVVERLRDVEADHFGADGASNGPISSAPDGPWIGAPASSSCGA